MKIQSFFLGVCISASIIAPAAVWAADDTDSSAAKSQQPVTDTWITTKVKTELASTDGIKSGDIAVTTKNGLVTLSGVVSSKAQAEKASAVAKAVKGVREVDDSALKSRD